MDTTNLSDELRERLSIMLDVDPGSIEDGTSFVDLEVDSMMRLELIALVEQRIGYELPEQDLFELITIDRVVGYVAALEA